MKENLTAIILSAGKGKRFLSDIPKTFLKLDGKPLFWYSLYSFSLVDAVDNIYMVVSEEMLPYAREMEKRYLKDMKKFRGFITGGNERFDSVYNALQFVSKTKPQFIALHDAARPFIKKELINTIFNKAKEFGAASCGISVVDTIKVIDDTDVIKNHLKRDNIIAIQTPQIFRFDKLLNNYSSVKNTNRSFTDDTEVYGINGDNVFIVCGDKDLQKITYKEDLITAKEILKRNKKLWR